MTPTTIPGLTAERCMDLASALASLGVGREQSGLSSAALDAFNASDSYRWIARHPTDPRCPDVLLRAWSGKPPPEDAP